MSKYDEIVLAFGKDIGYTEKPKNSNKTKYGEWYGNNGQPWCMTMVQYKHDEIDCKLPYQTASCSQLLNWYKKNRPEYVYDEPQKGFIIIYNFGHTGVVESSTSTKITAIEGNTSATNAGSQSNGGGVYRKTRSKTTVTAYIDGIGTYTKERLEKEGKEEPKEKVGYEFKVTLNLLKNGSVSPQVTALQHLLNGYGFNCGEADGIFGTKTDSAVRKFQKSKGLQVDGQVGENTARALLGVD